MTRSKAVQAAIDAALKLQEIELTLKKVEEEVDSIKTTLSRIMWIVVGSVIAAGMGLILPKVGVAQASTLGGSATALGSLSLCSLLSLVGLLSFGTIKNLLFGIKRGQ